MYDWDDEYDFLSDVFDFFGDPKDNPDEGDVYFDKKTRKLMIYKNKSWAPAETLADTDEELDQLNEFEKHLSKSSTINQDAIMNSGSYENEFDFGFGGVPTQQPKCKHLKKKKVPLIFTVITVCADCNEEIKD